jgi:hypothetical protein
MYEGMQSIEFAAWVENYKYAGRGIFLATDKNFNWQMYTIEDCYRHYKQGFVS